MRWVMVKLKVEEVEFGVVGSGGVLWGGGERGGGGLGGG